MKQIISGLVIFLSSSFLLAHGEKGGLRRTQGRAGNSRLLEDIETYSYVYNEKNYLYNGYNSTNNSRQDNYTTKSNIITKAQQYKDVAESKAWEFYETAPAEWTTSQWDLVFALFGSVLLSCCLASMCCAYLCWYNDQDEELTRNTIFYGKSQRTQSLDDDYMRYEDEFSITSESLHEFTVASPMSIECQRKKRNRFGRNFSSQKWDDESIVSCDSVNRSTVASKSSNAPKTSMFGISDTGVTQAPERTFEGESKNQRKNHFGKNLKSCKKTTKPLSKGKSSIRQYKIVDVKKQDSEIH
mmetsp:Transcript_25793/g.53456  ORF Transcript_25793/g.53456 Transcript_25793/m.53456 type:complete len:299 (+) Transcript_25793:190-1086(+)